MANKKPYKFLDHTADIKFKVYGKNLDEVFENSTLAVSDFLARGKKIKSKKERKIKLKGEDLEDLYYNFLDELVYLLDAKEFVVSKAKLKIDEKSNSLKGKVFGDLTKHYSDLDHFKAATYAEMYIKKKKDGWEAQAVLDV